MRQIRGVSCSANGLERSIKIDIDGLTNLSRGALFNRATIEEILDGANVAFRILS